ncbi:MAG: DUF433 domain-containing protein [Betaproteobacteria bacterium]|nr:DUF433 domain-containing protein [Betaproteobacteria bacterium]
MFSTPILRPMLMTKAPQTDFRETPLYTAAEAAHYLRVPVSTVRAWAFGQGQRKDGSRRFKPVIALASRQGRLLSFINLVELFVLTAIRRHHGVVLPKVRKALDYLKKRFPSPHPFADNEFQTNGVDLFVEKFGEYLNLSREGQIEIRGLIEARLRCVLRDEAGMPLKLYLSPRADIDRGIVVIDPRLGFGRPVIEGTGIRTEVIVGRFSAGETIDSIAEDYGRSRSDIEEIVRSELPLAA